MMRSLGALFTRGFPVKWDVLYPQGQIVDLPQYRWQNQSYWLPKSGSVSFARVEPPSVSATENSDWFYDQTWTPLPEVHPSSAAETRGEWLILAGQKEIGSALAERLIKYGIGSRLALNGEPQDEGAWLQNSKSPLGIVDVRALSAEEPVDDSVCLRVLSSVKALVNYRGATSPKLWIVTQGVQKVENEVISVSSASQSLLLGLGRTISLEHPEVWGGMLDLGPGQASELAELIARELTLRWSGEDLTVISFRRGAWEQELLALARGGAAPP